ncbi:MAG: hemolysin family protein [Chitinophagales bacterium]
MNESTLLVVFLTLLASALFSGLELAFISANKLKVALIERAQSLTGRTITLFYKSPSQFLGTTLTGNNIALVAFTLSMAELLAQFTPVWIAERELLKVLTETLISTLIVLTIAEFLPKSLFRINPSSVLKLFALPFLFVYVLLYPFVSFVVWLATILLKLVFNIEYEEAKPALNRVDLQHYISQNISEDSTENNIDTVLFGKALHLTEVKLRECMVPRPEINGVEINESTTDLSPTDLTVYLSMLKKSFVETGHSKLIVYQENIDNITGYVHHQDILRGKFKLWDLIVVPETMTADKLLNKFIKTKKSIAWIVDEFGGTAGIVTMEDIIEEVFGEIRDEHDDDALLERKLSSNKFAFSGRLELDYLNEKYAFTLLKGDVETLGGYVVTNCGRIPKNGERLVINEAEFLITKASKTRIEALEMTLK